MQVISSWTGGKADVLRQALRMTQESFADHLGVVVRTVAYWRQRPDSVPQQQMQEILDTAFERASDRDKARFARLLAEARGTPSGTQGLERKSALSEVGMRQVVTAARKRMTEAEITSIVDRLADIARVLNDVDPDDKSEIYRQLGLKLTYHPGRGIVEAEVRPADCGFFESVRGGT